MDKSEWEDWDKADWETKFDKPERKPGTYFGG